MRLKYVLLFCLWIIFVSCTPSSFAMISGTLPPNDDDSSSFIPLDFTFKFYGKDYNGLYINNNGNLSFAFPTWQYTPDAFPSTSANPMIAPFYADVDTRNGRGTVIYSGNADSFKVNWNNTGYYSAYNTSNPDLRNTFSVTIQKNNGIIFQYGRMSWTTGDASDGTNGFGGTPATLGIDKGNGIDSVPFRRYDNYKVSELQGTTWYFQTDNANLNTPLFKQFTGTPGVWGGQKTLNDATDTMKSTGCFVTSAAMVLNSLGHNTDPGKLNVFLRDFVAANTGTLAFSIIPQRLFYGQTDDVPGPPVRFRSVSMSGTRSIGPLLPGVGDTALRTQLVNQLRTVIANQGPVILRVPSRNWGMNGYGISHSHAIVVYEVTNSGQILIRDPGWSSSPGDLDSYVAFVNNYVRDVKNKPTWQLTNADGSIGGQDFSWLLATNSSRTYTYVETLTPFKKEIISGAANSPVELVITDPLGRRLGFNPTNGIFLSEIPDSVYYRELQPSPAGDFDLDPEFHFGPIIFQIGDFLEGVYTFDVFGVGDGPWSINFGVSDPVFGFDPFSFTSNGVATYGSLEHLTFEVSSPLNTVPGPATMLLLGPGLIGLAWFRRKFKK